MSRASQSRIAAKTPRSHEHALREATLAVVRFLGGIGLELEVEKGASGFCKGVRIDRGRLRYDPECLPSTLLHEAGHVAILPSRFRPLADGDLKSARRAMDEWFERALKGSFDEREVAKVVNVSDPEATAWAWAAGLAAGVRPDLIICTSEYQGDGQAVRLALSVGSWAGIKGLQHAGMCEPRLRGINDAGANAIYPRLARWLQDDVHC